MSADVGPASISVRILSCTQPRDRTASRPLAVGERSFCARDASHTSASHHSGRYTVCDSEADTGSRCGPEPAAHDDVHATVFRLHVLLLVVWTCTILLNRKLDWHRSTAHHQ